MIEHINYTNISNYRVILLYFTLFLLPEAFKVTNQQNHTYCHQTSGSRQEKLQITTALQTPNRIHVLNRLVATIGDFFAN